MVLILECRQRMKDSPLVKESGAGNLDRGYDGLLSSGQAAAGA
jgi:hypothetical protein